MGNEDGFLLFVIRSIFHNKVIIFLSPSTVYTIPIRKLFLNKIILHSFGDSIKKLITSYLQVKMTFSFTHYSKNKTCHRAPLGLYLFGEDNSS